jgi:hypothetical protein
MAYEHFGAPAAIDPHFAPTSIRPFLFDTEPAEVRESTACEAEFRLVQSTGPVDASECEELGVEAVEVLVLWGTNVLRVMHLSPPRAFYVGHADGAAVDYVVPAELAPSARAAVVELSDGVPYAVAPEGATLRVVAGPAPHPAATSGAARLLAGTRVEVRLGELCFCIAAVTAGKRVPRALAVDARGLGASFAASLAMVASFLGALAYYTPALGASLDDDLDRDRLALMRQYLSSEAERERQKPPPEAGAEATEVGGGTPGTAARGPEGKMGRPNRPDTQKRTAIAGSGELVLSREQAIAEARSIGMIGLLNTLNARAVPTAIWGAEQANGPDSSDAWGNMFGEDIGESGGAGGLGLTGNGTGGGYRGEWIGMGTIGTCGSNCGVGPGTKGGFGSDFGRGGKMGHAPGAPRLRAAGNTVVSGRLPPELIQRVVRQNYGRFRACYENGLRTNPNLTGRVTARFIIGRDGSVSNAANGGSDLPDSSVVGCVVSAFYGLSFPAPEGGIVTVSYPLMLSPS